MAKTVTAANLEEVVRKTLDDYGNEVKHTLDEITKTVTKKGVQALKTESAETFGTTRKRDKKYAKTWTSSIETNVLSTQGVIYNTQSGLPHLLENGHVSRNGTGRTFGTVKGRPHISKVEAEIERVLLEEVNARL
jgi:hypothetical protein